MICKRPLRYIYVLGIITSISFLVLSCVKEDDDEKGSYVITFESANAQETETRALNRLPVNDFSLYGIKEYADNNRQIVFPNYTVSYYDNSANTTSSNTSGWDYVNNTQTIKFWDYGANYYLFWAVAPKEHLSFETTNSLVQITENMVESSTINNVQVAIPTYFTDPVKVKASEFGKPVQLVFKELKSKIRIGFFETIDDDKHTEDSYKVISMSNITISGFLPESSDVTIKYSNTGETPSARVTHYSTTSSYQKNLSLSVSGDDPLPTSSSAARFAHLKKDDIVQEDEMISIIPAEDNEQDLTLHCKYKLRNFNGKESEDISKTATVPAAYCKWKPSCTYTYLFKIVDMGDGISDMVLYEVKVDPWHKGGTQQDEWHNW